MGIRTIIICDCCGSELNEKEKPNWRCMDNLVISLVDENNKKETKYSSLIFCSLSCMETWLEKQYTAMQVDVASQAKPW